MRVRVGAVLHSYTGGATYVEAEGETLREVLEDLEDRHLGMRPRIIDEHDEIRADITIFVGSEPAHDFDHPVREGDLVYIVGAPSSA